MSDWPELLTNGPDGQAASFRGVWFHVQDESLSSNHALAVYEFPDRTGAEVRDMSRGARRFRYSAVFWGETYPNLTAFMAALDEAGTGPLVTPTMGTKTVAVENVDGPNQDHQRRRYAVVRVTFVQHEPTPDSLKLLAATSSSGLADKARAGTASAKSVARQRVVSVARQSKTGGLPLVAQVRKSFDEGARHCAAFGGVPGAVRRGQVGALTGALPGFDLPSGAGSWVDEPGAWCDEVDSAMVRRSQSVMGLASSPARLVRVLTAENQSLVQAVRQAVGPKALSGPASAIPDYIRISGADVVVSAATEALGAGLALDTGNPFEGPLIGLKVEMA